MMLLDAYLSLSEERALGGDRGIAVFMPNAECGLRCAFCYDRYPRPGREWSPARIAEWALSRGATALEWCGWPPLEEAREVMRLIDGRMPIVLKTSGADADRLPELLDRGRPFFDIYLPDFKFGDRALADLLADAPDYVDQCEAVLRAMARGFPDQLYGAGGALRRGVLVRHLMLPGFYGDTLRVIRRFSGLNRDGIWPLSLVDAYMPPQGIAARIDALCAASPRYAPNLRHLARPLTGESPLQARLYARSLGVPIAN